MVLHVVCQNGWMMSGSQKGSAGLPKRLDDERLSERLGRVMTDLPKRLDDERRSETAGSTFLGKALTN